jgi:hypothetical protein
LDQASSATTTVLGPSSAASTPTVIEKQGASRTAAVEEHQWIVVGPGAAVMKINASCVLCR